jgi:sulfate permease, SulP family
LVILAAFSGLVGCVAVPTLAAVLIVAAIGSFRIPEIVTILRTGAISQIALITTFLATLFLPVAAAVGIGVALSLLLQLNREALDLRVVELEHFPDGRIAERPAPTRLEDRKITAIDVYGSLFYAGARTLQARLPDPTGAESPVVVLRLRGRTALGATSLVVLEEYARRLAASGGRLYLSGVDPALVEQLERTGRLDSDGPVRVYPAHPVLGESSAEAYQDAELWLASGGAAATQRTP